jgi:hypothetical protein
MMQVAILVCMVAPWSYHLRRGCWIKVKMRRRINFSTQSGGNAYIIPRITPEYLSRCGGSW